MERMNVTARELGSRLSMRLRERVSAPRADATRAHAAATKAMMSEKLPNWAIWGSAPGAGFLRALVLGGTLGEESLSLEHSALHPSLHHDLRRIHESVGKLLPEDHGQRALSVGHLKVRPEDPALLDDGTRDDLSVHAEVAIQVRRRFAQELTDRQVINHGAAEAEAHEDAECGQEKNDGNRYFRADPGKPHLRHLVWAGEASHDTSQEEGSQRRNNSYLGQQPGDAVPGGRPNQP